MRAELAALLLLAACGPIAVLTRPEGNGGWSPERRQAELAERAAVALVAPDGGTREPERGAGPLRLDDALRLAAAQNRRIAEAERQVAIARERVAETRGRLLPATTGSGRYVRYTDPLTQTVLIPGITLPPGTPTPVVVVRERELTTVNGTLSLPLDVWGEIGHALTAAQAGYRGERARLWATTLEQEVRVIRAYFDLLAAERLREVTRETLSLDRQQLANAESRFQSGRLTKNDLLIVQVALSNAEQELLQRELAIDQTRWSLNEAVGLAVDAPTEVVDVALPPAVPAPAEALRVAHASNPVLVALLEEQQRLEDTATSLARTRLPRFSAGGAIDYSTSAIPEPQRIGSGFAGFTWDLGTDTRREAAIAQARLAADQNRIAIERELRELEAAVRSTQRSVAERLAARAAARAAVGQAEENLRIRQQQFAAGRAQSDDVLTAQAVLAQQRATLATALYQAHARRAELQQLMGLPLDAIATGER